MPNISYYLGRAHSLGAYDESELNRLQIVYEKALHELALTNGDARCDTLADIVFHVAYPAADTHEILRRALILFRKVY